MDALMAALVAAALGQVGDRLAWLTAILADRFKRPGLVLLMATLAVAGAGAVAATFGALLAPKLTPEATQLFLAMALVFQGSGVVGRVKAPERLDGWRIGAAATSFVGLFILAFGDGVQFIVLALAARTPAPWLAVAGATVGSLAVLAPAAILGEADWLRLSLGTARRVISALFLLAGAVLAIDALGLI